MATKEDFLATKEDLRRDMDSRFIQLEQRLIIKLGALMVCSITVVAALVKLLG